MAKNYHYTVGGKISDSSSAIAYIPNLLWMLKLVVKFDETPVVAVVVAKGA